MPFTDPGDAVSGATVPATWGDNVRASLLFLANPPACRVTKAAAQTITTGTTTAVLFDTERYDTAGMHSTSSLTTRITFPTAGLYVVGGNIRWQASSVGVREVNVRLNGSTIIVQDLIDVDSVIQQQMSVATVYKFAAADYVELMVQHTNGADLNVEKGNNYAPEFWATWIGLG